MIKNKSAFQKETLISRSNSFQDDVFTLEEASSYLSISKSALYKMNMDTIIPFYKPRRKVYYKKMDLDNYLFSNKNESTDTDFNVNDYFKR